MLEGLEQVPYIGEKIKTARSEGMQKGMQKGIEKGMEKGIKSDIIETLKIRFKSTNDAENLINAIHNVHTLRRVFHIALTTGSLEAFKKSVAKLGNAG